MKINNNLKKIAAKYPSLSLLGYNVLKKYWRIEAQFINYEYPANINLASVSEEQVLEYNKSRPFGPKKRLCYAPFNNLHFQMNGDVCSCSFNYDFTLGNVHKQTIHEIWFGEKANEFRTTLADFNLDKCISCKNVFESGNYSSFPPLKYDIHSDDKAQYPTQMSFELSNLCNYECVMCNEDFSSLIRKTKKLSPVKYSYPDDFADQLKEFIPYLSMVTFIGGEPLLIKSYYRIWEEIIQTNPDCFIHIQTNGSILTDNFLELLESGQFEIGVSIDAPTKITFEKIRLHSDFDEVEKNIQKLITFKNRGKIYMNFNFCPLTLNWKEMPQMIEYSNYLNIALKIVNVQFPANLALQHRSSVYLKKVYDYLKQYQFQKTQNSIIIQRNIKGYEDYVNSISFFIEEAKMRELFQKDNIHKTIEELAGTLYTQIYTIENFINFTIDEKEYIFNEMNAYVQNKSEDISIIKNIFIRIIYSFIKTAHDGENITGNNIETGLSFFNRIVDGFYELVNEEMIPATI